MKKLLVTDFNFVCLYTFIIQFYLCYIFRLKTIDLFESCSIQVGDTHWYTIKDDDELITMKQWRTKCTEGFTTGPGLLSAKIKKDIHHNKLLRNKKLVKKGMNPFESEDLADLDDLLSM